MPIWGDNLVLDKVGQPPRHVDAWLYSMGESALWAAQEAFWPWQKSALEHRADAFFYAADLIRKAIRKPEETE